MGPKTWLLLIATVCVCLYGFFKAFKQPLWGVVIVTLFPSFMSFFSRILPLPIPYSLLVDLYCLVLLPGTVIARRDKWSDKAITKVLIVYLAYLFVEVFNPESASLIGSAWQFFRLQLARYIFFFICLRVLDNITNVKIFLKALFFVIVLTGFYALKQKYLGFAGFEMGVFWGERMSTSRVAFATGSGMQFLYRVFSVYDNPAECGYMLSLGALIGFVLFFGAKTRKEKALYLSGSAVLLYAVQFPASRAAFIFCAMGMFILFAFRNIKYSVVLLVALGGLFLAVRGSDDPIVKYSTEFLNPGESASYAVRVENRAIMGHKLQSVLGYGMGSAGTTGQDFNRSHGIDLCTIPCPSDSLLVLLLYEIGIAGTALFVLLFVVGAYKSFRSYTSSYNEDVKTITAFCIAVLISSFSFWYSQNTYILYFYCALFAIVANFKHIEETAQEAG